jgi:ADP-ribosylation factor-like protein 1
VFANKQDAKGALKSPKIAELLGLDEIKRRQWTIKETSAKKGEGLTDGFDW